jgi:hypothetical protein
VILRISAQWKPTSARESLAIAPAAAEIEKPKTGGKEVKTNASPEKVASGLVIPGTNPPPKQ